MSFLDSATSSPAIALFQKSLLQGRLGHAYLVSGSDLNDLEIFAKNLAKTLNCQSPRREKGATIALDSCDHCSACDRIQAENHPDVSWSRPESKSRIITIQQIRNLLHDTHLKPMEARYKVGVVPAADRLTTEAANAFLKTLEEPPPHSIFVLLTTDTERVLETIVSRCLRLTFSTEAIPFHPLRKPLLDEFTKTAEDLKSGILGRYRLLAVIQEKLDMIRKTVETKMESRSRLSKDEDVDSKLKEKWENELNAAIESEFRKERAELLVGIQWWMRDVWLCSNQCPDLLAFPEYGSSAIKVSQRLSPDEAAQNLEILEKAQKLLSTNAQEALVLEVTLLNLKL